MENHEYDAPVHPHALHMDLLLTLRDPSYPDADLPIEVRTAARAVALDSEGRIPLLYVSTHAYHKLPGGGVDEGETLHEALAREMLEETGCEIAVGAELGEIVEYRSGHGFDWIRNLHQTSYCFLADITAKGVPEFTPSEIEEGFELRWMTLDEAIAQLERDMPDNAEGGFIVQRDLKFLRAAREARDGA